MDDTHGGDSWPELVDMVLARKDATERTPRKHRIWRPHSNIAVLVQVGRPSGRKTSCPVRPSRAASRPRRAPPLRSANLHSADVWRRIDGYSDEPDLADKELGTTWMSQISTAVAERFVELAGAM